MSFPSSLISLPPATRAITGALIILSTLFFVLKLSSNPNDLKGIFGNSTSPSETFAWLLLVPGNVVWYPWTLLTSSFVETNLIEFLFSLFTLPLAARYLERVWGQLELIKFVVVVTVASNVITVIVSVVESIVLGNKELFMYGMSYHGLMGLQVGFLVAFTQLIPEHQVQIFGGLAKMKVKSLPMLYVTVSNIACLIGYQSPWILIQFGWLVSWFYLRFIKMTDPTADYRGDRSETFAFASWFPPFIQPYVSKVASFAFDIACKVGVFRPWNDVEMGNYAAVPGAARAEAERRRAMALKALDQRMATKPGGSGSNGSSTNSPRMATVASLGGQPLASGSSTGAAPGSTIANATEGGDVVFDAATATKE